MKNLVLASELTKYFHQDRPAVLSKVSFSVASSEFVCLLGPSGSGKSTLLRILGGLESPTEGSLFLSPEAQARRSFVFQEPTLLEWRTAIENVALPLELEGSLSPQEIQKRARLELAELGLGDSLHRRPRELSGGMKMRTSIARSLVQKPQMLLMDEPFSALDEFTRHLLQEKTRALFESTAGMAVVFVTHSLNEAIFLADRILLLNHQGVLFCNEVVRLPQKRSAELRLQDAYFRELQRFQKILNQGSV